METGKENDGLLGLSALAGVTGAIGVKGVEKELGAQKPEAEKSEVGGNGRINLSRVSVVSMGAVWASVRNRADSNAQRCILKAILKISQLVVGESKEKGIWDFESFARLKKLKFKIMEKQSS